MNDHDTLYERLGRDVMPAARVWHALAEALDCYRAVYGESPDSLRALVEQQERRVLRAVAGHLASQDRGVA